MPDWASFIQERLIPGESLVDMTGDVKFNIGFVPFGEPMVNAAPVKTGRLALTNQRLMVQWWDVKTRLYSTPRILALSERFFDPSPPVWPYQATLILSGGVSLVIESHARDGQSAELFTRFLTKALFSLGSYESDIASMAAMNAHLEQVRRQQQD